MLDGRATGAVSGAHPDDHILKRSCITFGSERGQAVLLVVVAAGIFLIGALGLAIDGSLMYAHRQMAQSAADAAAQAGMMSIRGGTNITATPSFGVGTPPLASYVCTTTDGRTPCVYARYNGFGGTSSDTVTLSYPTAVTGVALSSASVPVLVVTVQRTIKTGLIQFMPGAPATATITAKGTAGLLNTVSPSCMYVLDPSASSAFQVTNGAQVTMNGCSIQVNSTSAIAAVINGAGHVTATAINVVGGASVSNGGGSNPAPNTGAPALADPFAAVPAPAFGGCDFTNYSKGSGTWTLNPGVYCGGISLHNGAIATFNPGTYILNGGGLQLAFSTSTGTGLMFYLTGTNATYGSVNISNGATVTFSAQSSGTYLGLLFFQDRSITSNVNAQFIGGSTMQLTGSLYFPTTVLNYSNGSTTESYSTGLVAKQIAFSGGTSSVSYDPTGQKTGLFSNVVALVQ
jgi:hypothetical protein